MNRYDLYCDGCGYWHTFCADGLAPECPTCKTCRYLTDNEPRGASLGLAAYHGADFDAVSDADPGL